MKDCEYDYAPGAVRELPPRATESGCPCTECVQSRQAAVPNVVAVVAHPASPSFHWVYLSDGRVLHFQADTGTVEQVVRLLEVLA